MTATARDILAAFDALDASEKQEVAVEILRRSAGWDELSEETLNELAAEVFLGYDVEEETGADR